MSCTWRDVVRVHLAHPKWPASRIAKHLRCSTGYVRATAKRRSLKLPRVQDAPKHARLMVPLADVLPFRLSNETAHQALKRIVAEAMKAKAA